VLAVRRQADDEAPVVVRRPRRALLQHADPRPRRPAEARMDALRRLRGRRLVLRRTRARVPPRRAAQALMHLSAGRAAWYEGAMKLFSIMFSLVAFTSSVALADTPPASKEDLVKWMAFFDKIVDTVVADKADCGKMAT